MKSATHMSQRLTTITAVFLSFVVTGFCLDGEFVYDSAQKVQLKHAELQKDPAIKAELIESAKWFVRRIEIHAGAMTYQDGKSTSKMTVTETGSFLLGTEKFADGTESYFPIYVKDSDNLYMGGIRFKRVKK